ncbi:MAG TPA: ABC transporter permease [Vicinamibacteria bacterium]|nr:ABC transporter permease [Vicinamibacteria bacterium]
MLDTIVRDVRFGLRALRKNPGFAAAAALTLGLGIGANAVMLSLVRGMLWRPPDVAQPERLAVVFAQNRADGNFSDFSYADYLDFKRSADVFSGVIGYYPLPLSLGLVGHSERAWGEMVSGNYFDVLGVRPALGRTLVEADDRPEAESVAVLSHRTWASRFESDPRVVGSVVRVSGHSFTVVGVAPRGFAGVYFIGFQPDVWVPAHALERISSRARLADRGANSFRVMGRLKPGATVEQAQAVAGAVASRLEKEYPATNTGVQAAVLAERDSRPEPENARSSSLIASVFLGGVGLVLLIACANVAGLLLARGTARQGELAIRLALGADRGRLLRQLLTESLLLAGAGGAIGLLAAWWATNALSAGIRLPTDIPFSFDLRLDLPSVLVSLGACVLAAIASGLMPALQSVGRDVLKPLRGEGTSGRSTARAWLRHALVVGQVAVSCVLLIAAGLALRSLRATRSVDPGFETRGGLLVSVAPGLQGYDATRGQAFYRALQQSASSLPGVRAAGLTRFVPLGFNGGGGPVYVEGAPLPEGQAGETAGWSMVTPGYFEAMGITLREGRAFDWRDDAEGRPVVVVNETLARKYWPGRSALGQKLRLSGPDATPVEVVGVAPDGKYGNLDERPSPFLFQPLMQQYAGEATLVVRTNGDPEGLVPAVRDAVRALDPEMPLYDVKTIEQLVNGRTLLLPRLAAQLALLFAGAAVLLAMVGLYGVVAFSVARRVREIGIRMALGASRPRIVLMVMKDGASLALLGVGLGLLGALAATRVLASVLFGVGATDVATFASVSALLLGVAALAAFVPARRATAVDPLSSLRSE